MFLAAWILGTGLIAATYSIVSIQQEWCSQPWEWNMRQLTAAICHIYIYIYIYIYVNAAIFRRQHIIWDGVLLHDMFYVVTTLGISRYTLSSPCSKHPLLLTLSNSHSHSQCHCLQGQWDAGQQQVPLVVQSEAQHPFSAEIEQHISALAIHLVGMS